MPKKPDLCRLAWILYPLSSWLSRLYAALHGVIFAFPLMEYTLGQQAASWSTGDLREYFWCSMHSKYDTHSGFKTDLLSKFQISKWAKISGFSVRFSRCLHHQAPYPLTKPSKAVHKEREEKRAWKSHDEPHKGNESGQKETSVPYLISNGPCRGQSHASVRGSSWKERRRECTFLDTSESG